MVFKRFQLVILGFTLLILAGTFGIVHYSYIEVNYIRLFFLGLYEALVIWAMISYLNKTNKDVSYFLNAILHNDFSIKYSKGQKGKTYQELYDAFNKVNQKFIDSTQSEASEYQYIVTLIEQMQVGVLIYDEKDRIHLVNNAFKEIINRNELIRVDGIKGVSEDLYQGIIRLSPSERSIVKTEIDNVLHQFSLVSSQIKIRGSKFNIVSVQDIKNELDINEMQAWQKLIRVLTHEIMNSVSPITSLSGSLKTIVNSASEIGPGETDMLKEGLDAIENRSKGLLSFTEAYRSLTKVPLPKIAPIEVKPFFDRIASIFKANLSEGIQFEMDIPTDSFIFQADQPLLEQVIINLLKNASEAIEDKGTIQLVCQSKEGKTIIRVIDSGSGIPEELRDKVFVPFYTTKVNGSGIGLSLSRQIIQLHQGQLSFETGESGTTFKIEL